MHPYNKLLFIIIAFIGSCSYAQQQILDKDQEVFELFMKRGCSVDDLTPTAALWVEAFFNGDCCKERVQDLLNRGANPNSYAGKLPILLAFIGHSSNDSFEIIKALVKAGARVACQDDTCQETPLIRAAQRGDTALLKYFLENGGKAQLDHQDCVGFTALMSAAYGAKVAAVRLLLTYKPRLDLRCKHGNNTPLELAYCALKEQPVIGGYTAKEAKEVINMLKKTKAS